MATSWSQRPLCWTWSPRREMTSSLVHEPQEGRWLSQLLSDTHSSTKHPWP